MAERIIKVANKTENFTISANEVPRRNDLSARAKGIHSYLMTLPGDWKLYKEELYQHFTEGRDAINTAFKELEKAGYIKKTRLKENGRFAGWDYSVYETSTINGLSEHGKPAHGKPYTENPQLLNTDLILSTDKLNTDNTSATATAVAIQEKQVAKKKKTDMSEQELALYHEIKRWFESKPESMALMYKDRQASGRTGRAIKTIVERCFTHSKQNGGDPIAIAKPMVSMFYKAIYEKTGRDKLRVTFTPVGLATEWVWDTIYMQCKDYVDNGSEKAIALKIQESLRRKEESLKNGGIEI